MPIKSKSDLPKGPKDVLPSKAQKIYREAYNSAYDEYGNKSKRRGSESREETASKVAWAAVQKKYKKGDDDKWHPKK
jgi:cation transport regulator